jgi:hypothetical protein
MDRSRAAAERLLSLSLQDFEQDKRKWGSCDPFVLFEAHIRTYVDEVSINVSNLLVTTPTSMTSVNSETRTRRSELTE